jgi:M6 family metalloprotease-like protein
VLRNEAVNLAAARGYDTSTNATTKLVILYAGNFYLSGLTPQNLGDSYIIFERWGGRGQYDDTYQNNPPYFYDLNAPFGHIGVHAHEFGHFFGWPDLYLGLFPIVEWDLMGDATDLGGTLGGTVIFSGSCPGPINPEFRRQQGWITVQDLTSDVLPATVTYNERTPTVYRRQVSTNEYFLAESKRFQGFGRFLPGYNLGHDGGLLIWQVQGTSTIYLERADNVTDDDYFNGEPNDIFPGPTVNNTTFHPLSTPNSGKLDGTRSGFGVTNISVISGIGVSANAYINYLVSNSTDATAYNSGR